MALDVNRVRKQQAEAKARTGGGNFYRPAEGSNNIIRVFTFSHEVTKDDVKKGYYEPDDVGEEKDDLARPVVLHYNMSANGGPVHTSEAHMEKYRSMKAERGKEAARQIAPTKKFVMNVVDINDLKGGMKLFTAPKTVFDMIAEYLHNPEYGGEKGLFGSAGRDFIISFDPKVTAGNMYKVTLRDKDRCKNLGSKAQEHVIDLYTDEAMNMVAEGWEGQEHSEEPAEPAERSLPELKKEQVSDKELDESMEEIFGPKGGPKGKVAPKKGKKEADPEVDLSALS